jgi:hypothetical protein
MCSSGGSVATEDKALQAAQLAQTQTLNADYGVAFGEQQTVLKAQQARLSAMVANPMGIDAPTLAAMRSSATEQTARGAAQAIGAASAAGARTASSDIGGSATAARVGQIGSEAEQARSAELLGISQQNQQMRRSQMMAGLEGLNQVGASYGAAAGDAATASSKTAGSAVSAGEGVVGAQEQSWKNLGSIIGGVGSIAGMAAGGFGNLDTTGSSTGGEQAKNFLTGL